MKKVEFTSYLDLAEQNRIRVRLTSEKGELKDLVFQYETFINKNWTAIVCYDCAHGFFHRDVMMPNGDKEKYSIEIDNLKNAAKYAEQDLKDRWEWYKERFIKKLKNKKL